MIRILFCIIIYNNTEEVTNFISECKKLCTNHHDIDPQFSVKINAGNPAPDHPILNKPWVSVSSERDNVGYFNGCSSALKNWTTHKKEQKPNYVIFCNTDISLDADFFKIIKKLKPADQTGLICPKIIDLNSDSNQNPFLTRRPSGLRLEKLRLASKNPLLFAIQHLVRSKFPRKNRKNEECLEDLIYAGHGSFMIFNQPALNFLQTKTFPAFLYGEEVFVSENLLRLKLSIKYNSELLVYHKNHSTTKLLSIINISKWESESWNKLLKAYFSSNFHII